MKGADQLEFVWVGGLKAGVQVQDTAKDRQGDGGDDDGFHVVAQPDDEDGSHGGFRETVQNDEVRLQNLADGLIPPEQYGDQDGEDDHQQEAAEGLGQGDADVPKQAAVMVEFHSTFQHPGRTAEDKCVEPACIRGDFPGGDDKQKKKYLNEQHHMAVLFYFSHIEGLGFAGGCRGRAYLVGSRLQRPQGPALTRTVTFPVFPQAL